MCVYNAYFINRTLQLRDVHKSRNLLILLSGPLQMTFFELGYKWTHNITNKENICITTHCLFIDMINVI